MKLKNIPNLKILIYHIKADSYYKKNLK